MNDTTSAVGAVASFVKFTFVSISLAVLPAKSVIPETFTATSFLNALSPNASATSTVYTFGSASSLTAVAGSPPTVTVGAAVNSSEKVNVKVVSLTATVPEGATSSLPVDTDAVNGLDTLPAKSTAPTTSILYSLPDSKPVISADFLSSANVTDVATPFTLTVPSLDNCSVNLIVAFVPDTSGVTVAIAAAVLSDTEIVVE